MEREQGCRYGILQGHQISNGPCTASDTNEPIQWNMLLCLKLCSNQSKCETVLQEVVAESIAWTVKGLMTTHPLSTRNVLFTRNLSGDPHFRSLVSGGKWVTQSLEGNLPIVTISLNVCITFPLIMIIYEIQPKKTYTEILQQCIHNSSTYNGNFVKI